MGKVKAKKINRKESQQSESNDQFEGDTSDHDSIIKDESDSNSNGSDTFDKKSTHTIQAQISQKRKLEENAEKNNNKKRKQHDLQKAPTVEELNQLRETENLFNSNLFRLQIDEMLKEIKFKEKYVKYFDKWFSTFTNFVDSISDGKEYEIINQKWLEKRNIVFPFIQNPSECKGIFNFFKPSKVSVIGSYNFGCALGPKITIDINIAMPTKSFQKGDYMNQRYHRKRALYLCHIASKLSDTDFVDNISFYNKGDPLKPLLKIIPAGPLSKYVTIMLHITCDEMSFKLNRFSPCKNNVRENWFFQNNVNDTEGGLPTSIYNFSVAADLALEQNESFRSIYFEKNQNLKDGLLLLKVWLRQRGLDVGIHGFSSYILSMYMVFLMQTKRLKNIMSSYQIIRNVWAGIAESSWNEEGKGVNLCNNKSETIPTVKEFHEQYPVVFIDSTGYLNICSQLSLDIYQRVKKESEMAVKFLDNSKINSFNILFMKHMPFHIQFDNIINIRDTTILKEIVSKFGSSQSQLSHCGNVYPQALKLISDILRKGLGVRVESITPELHPGVSWAVTDHPIVDNRSVKLGIIFNPDEALSNLDKGPSANLPEAAEFRLFWGARSELRKFQDGSITEACVWGPDSTKSRRRNFCREIVNYLLNYKFGIASNKLIYISDQLESILKVITIRPSDFEYGTGEEATMKLIRSYDSLCKELRDLSDLPLEINSVQGISPVFRYCEVFPCLATSYAAGQKVTIEGIDNILLRDQMELTPRLVSPYEAVIQLGMSGKWPDNLEAIKRIKAAFYIQIANNLKKQFDIQALPYVDHIDILKDGFVFRLRVSSQKEIGLLKQQIAKDGSMKYRDTDESLCMERENILLPRITSALHSLHQQHIAFGPSVCLGKRWLNSQMIDSWHFPSECVELLMASLFLNPQPYVVPTQPQAAFIRFLNLVGYTDWNVDPIFVNFNDEMSREQILEIESQFSTSRSTLPTLLIATPYDTKIGVWSKGSPSLQVLVKIAILARECLKLIQNLYESESFNFKNIFTPCLEDYDIVIHLRSIMDPTRYYSLKKYKLMGENDTNVEQIKKLPKYVKNSKEKLPIIGYNPVECYLKELRDGYDEFALFFHDSFGGDVIGVLWKPETLQSREFKTSVLNGSKIHEAGDQIKLKSNISTFIEDFYILGQGIVSTIENKSNKDLL